MHGVCSLDILAAEALDAGLDEFVVATDARRKEVYLASYAGGRRVSGPEVVKPVDAATERSWSAGERCSTRTPSRTPPPPGSQARAESARPVLGRSVESGLDVTSRSSSERADVHQHRLTTLPQRRSSQHGGSTRNPPPRRPEDELREAQVADLRVRTVPRTRRDDVASPI